MPGQGGEALRGLHGMGHGHALGEHPVQTGLELGRGDVPTEAHVEPLPLAFGPRGKGPRKGHQGVGVEALGV